jgi:hypothetical protein
MGDRVRVALRQRRDEGSDPVRVLIDLGGVRDQDELVVGRDTELVDRDHPGVEPAQREVDPLDVPEGAEDRVDLAADQGRQQVEPDVHLVDVRRSEVRGREDRLQIVGLVRDPRRADRLAVEVR